MSSRVFSGTKSEIKDVPSQEELQRLFYYDSELGVLLYKVRTAKCVKVGDVAGNLEKNGYTRVMVGGGMYMLHRLIWQFHNGNLTADFLIDHRVYKKGEPKDNRIENLRLCDHSRNRQNIGVQNNNEVQLKGVIKRMHNGIFTGKYRAQITHNKKRHSLGDYSNIFDAWYAYRQAEKEIKGTTFKPQKEVIPLNRVKFNHLLEFAAKMKIRRDQITVTANTD